MSRTLLREGADTQDYLADNRAHAQSIALVLLDESVEFHVEPYPDDQWMFSVKAESVRAIEEAIAAIYPEPIDTFARRRP